MTGVDVVIFHQPPRPSDPPLVRDLAEARARLVAHQEPLFRRAGATDVHIVPGREDAGGLTGTRPVELETFGRRLARLVSEARFERLIVLGSGAVPRLTAADARRLVEVARAHDRRAATNNRYSSDICAVSDASALRELPTLPSDNALPRWLEERCGFAVTDLPGRDRLALDLDTPLDVCLLALTARPPARVVAQARERNWEVPNQDALRALARDPRREILVFGRSGSSTLRWLERNVRCRVRFLAEERGLRASSLLAIGGSRPAASRSATPRLRSAMPCSRPPRASLGRLLSQSGPEGLASLVGELADGAIIDTRVLMADRWGIDEEAWPGPADRFASDLFLPELVGDAWLQGLTRSAATTSLPITLGSHTLVGPGIPILLGAGREGRTTPAR